LGGQCGRRGKKPLKFPNGQKRDKPSKDHNAAQRPMIFIDPMMSVL
jgi:hypothetical protein